MLVFHFKGQGHHKYNYKVSKENLTVVKEYLVTNICSGNAYQNKNATEYNGYFQDHVFILKLALHYS